MIIADTNSTRKLTSTLLRILSGQEPPSDGQVIRVKSARVGVLEQDHFAFESTPSIDVVMMGNKVLWDAMVEKDALLERAQEHFDEARFVVLEDIVTLARGVSPLSLDTRKKLKRLKEDVHIQVFITPT